MVDRAHVEGAEDGEDQWGDGNRKTVGMVRKYPASGWEVKTRCAAGGRERKKGTGVGIGQ
jgi:hypothetical protein